MLRKFKLEDIDNFVPQKEQCIGSEWDKKAWIQYYLGGLEMITAEDDEGVVGFCAFVPDTMGNETICMVFGERTKKTLREMIRAYDLVFGKRLAKRTQGFVKKGWDTAEKFALHFGFEYEGTLRNFGLDGEDYNVYAIIRGVKK